MKSKIVCSLLLVSGIMFTGCAERLDYIGMEKSTTQRFVIPNAKVSECPDFNIVSSSSETNRQPIIEKVDTPETSSQKVTGYISKTHQIIGSACKNKDAVFFEVKESYYSSKED